MTIPFESLVARFPSIGLEGIEDLALLEQRFDRKYVVDIQEAERFFTILPPTLFALEIGEHRSFSYESCYFDTADLESFRGTAHRRRRRWKVRTRSYTDTDTSTVEVKVREQRGQSLKYRLFEDAPSRQTLTTDATEFIDKVLNKDRFAETLTPTLQTSYQRISVVDPERLVRLTADLNVRCRTVDGREVSVNGVVIETKSAEGPSPLDRTLWRRGHRPIPLSKYATGMAATHSALPGNKWHRTINQHFTR